MKSNEEKIKFIHKPSLVKIEEMVVFDKNIGKGIKTRYIVRADNSIRIVDRKTITSENG